MINVWDVVSKLIHFPKMFLSMDILLEQQMGQTDGSFPATDLPCGVRGRG